MIPRSILNVLFIALMALSLACNNSTADGPIAESADMIIPVAKGEQAPAFVVETVAGESFVFDPQNLERPVVLLTFRGGWCPYCNTHLSEVRHVIPEIGAMDVDVLFLSGDRAEMLYDSLKQETQQDIAGLDYTILSDADAEAAIALGVAFKASDRTIDRRHQKGNDIDGSSMMRHGVLPVPAVFAIDRQGIVQFSYTNPDYKVRLPANELLAAAREMAAAH